VGISELFSKIGPRINCSSSEDEHLPKAPRVKRISYGLPRVVGYRDWSGAKLSRVKGNLTRKEIFDENITKEGVWIVKSEKRLDMEILLFLYQRRLALKK